VRLVLVLLVVAALAVAGWFMLGSPSGAAVATTKEPALVTRIVDGDTIVVEGGQKVRLLGMDTDERGEPCYSEAKNALAGLIRNKEVQLERDGDDKDMYGRLLRWIWLDNSLINEEMVKLGLAAARFEQPVHYEERIAAAEKVAIDGKLGCKWANLTK
jgi:micrococcal nuclease